MVSVKQLHIKEHSTSHKMLINFSEILVDKEIDGQNNSHEQTWNGLYQLLLLMMIMKFIGVVSRQ
jgi:hypothetical protein